MTTDFSVRFRDPKYLGISAAIARCAAEHSLSQEEWMRRQILAGIPPHYFAEAHAAEIEPRESKARKQRIDHQVDRFVCQLATKLDPAARAEFGEIERAILRTSMVVCGMSEYPPVSGDEHGERAGGSMICDRCGHEYFAHPPDWRVIGYGDVPFLNVLCDGRRVKL